MKYQVLIVALIVLAVSITAVEAQPSGYITNFRASSISIVETATNTVTRTIPAGCAPEGVALSPDGAFVYVANQCGNNVSVIETSSNTVTATVPVGGQPRGIGVTPDGAFVYVSNAASNTISVIDTSSNTVAATIPVGQHPVGIAATPDRAFVYAGNFRSHHVSVIDTSTNVVTATIPVGNGPWGVAVSADGAFAYVANRGSSTVSVIDTSANVVTTTIPVGGGPFGITVSPDGAFVYVTNSGSNSVSVIETSSNTVVATIAVGSLPFGVAVTPDGASVHVANFNSNTVSVIDTSSRVVTATIPVGNGPVAFGQFIGTIATSQHFTVNDTGDAADAKVGDGRCETIAGNAVCTLRAAIQEANASRVADVIAFNISGDGPHTIRPRSPLPPLTAPVTIDGYTQPGASANTNGPGSGGNAVLIIELDGTDAGNADGLRIASGEGVIRGLVINRFQGSGIRIDTAGGNTIAGNYIGTDPGGTTALGNRGTGGGVAIIGVSLNVVGGTSPADRNVISGGHFIGVMIGGGDAGANNIVQGNFIGTTAAGSAPLGNDYGVWPNGVSNTIGGTTPGARNVISGNLQAGVLFSGAFGTRNVVRGNFIGTDVTGTIAVPNTRGLWILLSDNTIGGATAGAGNVISGNGVGVVIDGRANPNPGPVTGNVVEGNSIGFGTVGPLGNISNGVHIDFASNTTIRDNTIAFNGGTGVSLQGGAGNLLERNRIFSNAGLGIDLSPHGVTPNDRGDGDTGANELQNFPVVHTATTGGSGTTIQGTLDSTPDTTFALTLFSNPTCDASGFGEGTTPIASLVVTTNAGGHASFVSTTPPAAPGQFVTATATNLVSRNSSEFSQCVEVRGAP